MIVKYNNEYVVYEPDDEGELIRLGTFRFKRDAEACKKKWMKENFPTKREKERANEVTH